LKIFVINANMACFLLVYRHKKPGNPEAIKEAE
jgi:hypothetical protein